MNKDLKYLEQHGYRYVFLDEVTLMEDFIEGAALFFDVFAACGMKIVLSGTDSLGFLFTEDEQLYDRCITMHMTFISYREFERVMGIHGIDEYIRYGGTMSLGDVNYNEKSTFASKKSVDEYDLTREIEVVSMANLNRKAARTVLAQPGLRYAQADALVKSLLLDERFSDLSLKERNFVTDQILNEIKGRMMEDIVLLETKLANPRTQIFVLQFAIGEFDMVVFNEESASCQIFEIKHSDQIVPQQYRHLMDEKKCADTEYRYGTITGKYVLYRGESQKVCKVQYWDVEDYLKSL